MTDTTNRRAALKPMDAAALERSFVESLNYMLAVDFEEATVRQHFAALSYVVRDRLADRWLATKRAQASRGAKTVCYLSLEFLIGRLLGSNLLNLGITEQTDEALRTYGLTLDDLRETEVDAGLGGGGLGRLAACFMDSLATLEIPAIGYGIRYEFGIFRQVIEGGAQVERPDDWLRHRNPWEIKRSDISYPIRLYGRLEHKEGEDGRLVVEWVDYDLVLAMPFDTPVPGYRNNTVNTLRLWSAKPIRELDLADFNRGDFLGAVEQKAHTEGISKVLYPNDQTEAGRELRLKQQYFFCAATLADVLSREKRQHGSLASLPERVTLQLNDTHPAIAIPELLRLLIDQEGLLWDEAWGIAVRTFAYTNHTTLPEALEVWSLALIATLLPRHVELIVEINRRLLADVEERWPGDEERRKRMSIIDIDEDGEGGWVRMAHLAIAGSHSVNGVAELHTQLLKDEIFRDFYELFPWKFNNKTNGITQRRWLAKANPPLARLVSSVIGDGWTRDLDELRRLDPFAADAGFRESWRAVKQQNKDSFARYLEERHGMSVDPRAMVDVQIKRIHEYKRQLLNVLSLVARYRRIKADPGAAIVPRTVVFAGKAAPSYFMAKLIIRLINGVADVINNDAEVGTRLRVLFLPNYRVSLAERIIPASDLSQQISTAGTEASGTGNMKLALNGALTIGTLDGANIEIRREVGEENIFIFGATATQIQEIRALGEAPRTQLSRSPELEAVIADIAADTYCADHPGLFEPILSSLLDGGDHYCLIADFDPYMRAQDSVDQAWLDEERWTRMSVANVAGMGRFSSDRTIREYARDIWAATPVHVNLSS